MGVDGRHEGGQQARHHDAEQSRRQEAHHHDDIGLFRVCFSDLRVRLDLVIEFDQDLGQDPYPTLQCDQMDLVTLALHILDGDPIEIFTDGDHGAGHRTDNRVAVRNH